MKKKKKKVCVSIIVPQLAIGSRRPRAASQSTLNKQAPLGRCEVKNGTFRTSVKIQWVGAAECVCERLLAIYDLSGEAMKLTFIRAGTLSPCEQPMIKQPVPTVPVPLINTDHSHEALFLHYCLHSPKYIRFMFAQFSFC